jgi:hypothetical protein
MFGFEWGKLFTSQLSMFVKPPATQLEKASPRDHFFKNSRNPPASRHLAAITAAPYPPLLGQLARTRLL